MGPVGAVRWCQAASTSRRLAWVLPVLVIEPCDRDSPLEDSDGTNLRYAPIEEPVNRCHSPISTVSPSAVSVSIPRRQPSLATTGCHAGPRGQGGDRGIESGTAVLGHDHRLVVGVIGAPCTAGDSKRCAASHPWCAPVHVLPPP